MQWSAASTAVLHEEHEIHEQKIINRASPHNDWLDKHFLRPFRS